MMIYMTDKNGSGQRYTEEFRSEEKPMKASNVKSREDWLAARVALLEKEKKLTRLNDELTRERQALPWVKITEDYKFDGPSGRVGLLNLFGDSHQLVVYHFMFGAEWTEGCKSCSFWADTYNGTVEHLAARDVALLAISRGPLDKLNAFKKRMCWTFDWYSSAPSNFNRDFDVSCDPADIESGDVTYNFHKAQHPMEESPGLSVFVRDDDGAIYHTYSTYGRGLDAMNGAYRMLDLVPMGRNEGDLPFTMSWLRHRDRYGAD